MNARVPSQARAEIVPRRGLNRVEAARYIGVSVSKFDEMVKNNQMPAPIRIGSRVIWDLRKLDAAFDALSDLAENTRNPWDD